MYHLVCGGLYQSEGAMFMNHEPSLKTDHIRPPHPKTPSPFPRKLVSETVTPTTPMMMMIQNVIFVCTCLYVYTV